MKTLRKILIYQFLVIELSLVMFSSRITPMSFASQNNVQNYEYTLWIGGFRYNFTVPTPGGRQMLVYPLHVYAKNGTFLKTFHITRESTKYDWPNSGTAGDPYGKDATCPPGIYWATYDNATPKTRPRIILSDKGPTAWEKRTITSDLGTQRVAIQIHKLYNDMWGCMGLPTQDDMTELMKLLYGAGNVDPLTGIPKDEAWAATILLKVIIVPADFARSYLSIPSSEGGTTDPPTGEHAYPYGTKGGDQGDENFPPLINCKFAEVEAIADLGYEFDHWELDGTTKLYKNPTSVNMSSNHAIHAVFKRSSGRVGGVVVPVDKFALLAPYIGLTSTVTVAAVATVVYVKRVKRRKE